MTREEEIANEMAHRSINTNGTMIFTLTPDQRDVIVAALRSTQSLSGCLHPGNEPLSCQYEGKCLSASCNHNGKTWRAPRMTVLAQDPNLLYPNQGD